MKRVATFVALVTLTTTPLTACGGHTPAVASATNVAAPTFELRLGETQVVASSADGTLSENGTPIAQLVDGKYMLNGQELSRLSSTGALIFANQETQARVSSQDVRENDVVILSLDEQGTLLLPTRSPPGPYALGAEAGANRIGTLFALSTYFALVSLDEVVPAHAAAAQPTQQPASAN